MLIAQNLGHRCEHSLIHPAVSVDIDLGIHFVTEICLPITGSNATKSADLTQSKWPYPAISSRPTEVQSCAGPLPWQQSLRACPA